MSATPIIDPKQRPCFVNIQDMDAKGQARQGMHERKETEVQSEVSGPVIYN